MSLSSEKNYRRLKQCSVLVITLSLLLTASVLKTLPSYTRTVVTEGRNGSSDFPDALERKNMYGEIDTTSEVNGAGGEKRLLEEYGPTDRSKLIYAEVPKTASTTLDHLFRSAGEENGVRWYQNNAFRFLVGRRKKQALFVKRAFITHRSLRGQPKIHKFAYCGHVKFIDFREFNETNPIWISWVRHPVDRFISYFYYIRRCNRPYQRMLKAVGPVRAEQWKNASLETCDVDGWDECNLKPGVSEFEPSPIAFLCGYANFCTLHGSREALETAKSNVERFFQLVGIMEMSHESIQMFERVAPEFLTGISNKTLPHLNASPVKHEVSEEVRRRLADVLELELDLYAFLMKRFLRQYHASGISRPLTILNPNTGHEEAKFIAKGEEDDISTDPNDRHENTNATDKKLNADPPKGVTFQTRNPSEYYQPNGDPIYLYYKKHPYGKKK